MNTGTVTAVLVANGVGTDHMNGWGWGMLILAWVFMASIVVLIAWFGWSAIARNQAGPVMPRPIDILNERYARGEIDQDEYLLRKADLEETQ